jgi:putative PIN family toxin of toxin-antitoxin system
VKSPRCWPGLSSRGFCEILELLTAAAFWVEPAEKVEDCRDAKDNRYLELALAAKATAIVSGDTDLLTHNPWRDVRVLRLAEFLEEA